MASEQAEDTAYHSASYTTETTWSEAVAAPGVVSAAYDRAALKRRSLVYLLRALVIIVVIGGWELGARTQIIDPFFWGQPSGVWKQLVTWAQDGTAQGPLWEQIFTTLQEALYGFVIGVLLGVVLGINRFLADVIGPYIKALNSIPRVVLGSIFAIGLGLGTQSKVALATVLVFSSSSSTHSRVWVKLIVTCSPMRASSAQIVGGSQQM